MSSRLTGATVSSASVQHITAATTRSFHGSLEGEHVFTVLRKHLRISPGNSGLESQASGRTLPAYSLEVWQHGREEVVWVPVWGRDIIQNKKKILRKKEKLEIIFKRGETDKGYVRGHWVHTSSTKQKGLDRIPYEITPLAYAPAFKNRFLKLPVLQPISSRLIFSERVRESHSFLTFSV